ncbi:MAG: hypothetical protein QW818_01565 [Candidatus Aenigmatarchaeota archaeon]|nr:hypothetical protein [Candidatus Aenigmarchaeota archaeon]
MARLIVAIDTSHNKRYSCVVSGFANDADKLHNEIDKILTKYNQKGPFHWRKIPSKVRRVLETKFTKLLIPVICILPFLSTRNHFQLIELNII